MCYPRADPEFAARIAHRCTAVTAAAGLMEHHRAVLLDESAQQRSRRSGELHATGRIRHQKNPSLSGE
jgi:hypothetical protein